MNSRAFLLVNLAVLLLGTGCGSTEGSGSGGGDSTTSGGSMTTGAGGAAPEDCMTVCKSSASKCGQDPAQCGQVCAMNPSAAQIKCLEAAGCDLAAAGQCLKSSSSTSSTSTSSAASGSSSSGGSMCIDNNASGCTTSSDCCDMSNNVHVSCTMGTCCMPSNNPCKLGGDQCCTGLTCTNVGGSSGLCM